MSREIKFRVWSEFEIDGKLHKAMDGPESWFLLTQTGKLMSHGPMSFNPNVEQQCKKLIPMFYTGPKDKNGKENFHKDILDWDGNRFVVEWDDDNGMWYGKPIMGNIERGTLAGLAFGNTLNVGNIHENPELLGEKCES